MCEFMHNLSISPKINSRKLFDIPERWWYLEQTGRSKFRWKKNRSIRMRQSSNWIPVLFFYLWGNREDWYIFTWHSKFADEIVSHLFIFRLLLHILFIFIFTFQCIAYCCTQISSWSYPTAQYSTVQYSSINDLTRFWQFFWGNIALPKACKYFFTFCLAMLNHSQVITSIIYELWNVFHRHKCKNRKWKRSNKKQTNTQAREYKKEHTI